LDGPVTIAGDKTNANHITDFGIGMLGANGIVATDFDAAPAAGLDSEAKELRPCRPKAK